MNNVLLIVGQRFVTSTMPENVHGIADFISALKGGRYDHMQGEHLVYFGQGINDYDRRFVRDEIAQRALSLSLAIQESAACKASRSHVHKHLEKNVLLADLEPDGPGRLRARLTVDDDNELLQDHTTGWHISGMVILEAMRQMAMAAAERHDAIATLGGRYGFMVQNWNTAFDNFLFPLETQISSELHLGCASKAKRLEFQVEVQVTQLERVVAKGNFEFAVMARDTLDAIEERYARTAVKQFFQAESALQGFDPQEVAPLQRIAGTADLRSAP